MYIKNVMCACWIAMCAKTNGLTVRQKKLANVTLHVLVWLPTSAKRLRAVTHKVNIT